MSAMTRSLVDSVEMTAVIADMPVAKTVADSGVCPTWMAAVSKFIGMPLLLDSQSQPVFYSAFPTRNAL